MQNTVFIEMAFGPERAAVYDDQFVDLRAMKDAMHLVIRGHFATLPDDARILVVGAGTGAEVRYLAPLFPGWRFTLVDPAPAMLAEARKHAEAGGFADRCTIHQGYLDTAPEELHDAALSVLVSHFLTETAERCAFFEQIGSRLRPGGLLFDADLSADVDDASFEPLMELWLRMLPVGAFDPSQYREMFGVRFAAHGPTEVEAILTEAGFVPAPAYQFGLVRGWTASRAG